MKAEVASVNNLNQKGEGFPGQRIVVLPRPVLVRAEKHPLLRGLLPTDVGYFPKANGHLRERSHGADQAIFIFCVHGQGWCELAGIRHVIGPGEMLVVPPDTPHTYGADALHPWSIHWFHAKGTLLDDFLNELSIAVDRPVIHVGENSQVLALFGELLSLIEHGYTTLQLLCASHTLTHLLTVLIREHRSAHHKEPGADQKIAQTIAFMKQHLNQSLQLDELAAIANLSRSRFVEVFRKRTGYAPIDYFIRLRIHRACQLLDTTDSDVKAVALSLGYEDPLYFSRIFKRVNDCTPTEYRKMRKG